MTTGTSEALERRKKVLRAAAHSREKFLHLTPGQVEHVRRVTARNRIVDRALGH